MKRVTAILLFIFVASCCYATDVEAAIAYGQGFNSRKQCAEAITKARKVQISSAWAWDGISKYVTFFTDDDVVATAAAEAKMEMRTFTVEDAQKLPLRGVLFAHLELTARGAVPVSKLVGRYIKYPPHLVLEIDGAIIQPIQKGGARARDASLVLPVAFYNYWQSNNFALLTGGPLGYQGEHAEMEFAFPVSEEMLSKPAKVILIDGQGKRHEGKVDFAAMFAYQSKTP